MARVTIDLPDDLYRAVKTAGLPVSGICRRALTEALGDPLVGEPRYDASAHDGNDDARYQAGYDLGVRWAREEAGIEELTRVAAWAGQWWRQIAFDPASHSLPTFYCKETGREPPPPGQDYWFEREAFTMGVVEGAAAALREATGF